MFVSTKPESVDFYITDVWATIQNPVYAFRCNAKDGAMKHWASKVGVVLILVAVDDGFPSQTYVFSLIKFSYCQPITERLRGWADRCNECIIACGVSAGHYD
jgi:hypothetical protein